MHIVECIVMFFYNAFVFLASFCLPILNKTMLFNLISIFNHIPCMFFSFSHLLILYNSYLIVSLKAY